MLISDWWNWAYFRATFRKFWKYDPCLYQFLLWIRGHPYTRRLILWPISAARPRIDIRIKNPTGIPSYLRGIKYPGIFQRYHLENTPHSSRILRQLVCTVTCMGFNAISESFFHLKTPYEALFCSQCITAINIFLSLHYTEILNSIIIPSIPYRTRHARSLSLRATQFWEKTNSQQTLTYDNFLFLTDLLNHHSLDL